ncbi:GNAT family N-acetyltransferase [Streptomyces griseomycini]|uniref:GNAT superfamily N-acetyltransferase n=1 Tax=Streptomyces griseomycini TaxID=66895 RepID=A0A7W7PVI8_9ACTN|nr:GNAT family N-acetyltransferase [Streptomyces griseomycini]MBB4902106.1 GNAT superfamily N-acetyltransferase [Streptomyces griseomycini]GGR37180.1 N-acetyltransferase [Streptomyces griseomycini]
MNGDRLDIRAMTVADCDRVAEIRVRGWQHAYRGLVPQPYLDGLDVAADAERHRERLLSGDGSAVNLVAEADGGELAGWAAFGPYRDGDTRTEDAELYALYLLPERIGRGVGRALLGEAVRRCSAAGHARMYLWVLRGNTRARRFYACAGFCADGAEEPFEVGGVSVPEVRYAKDLAAVRG